MTDQQPPPRACPVHGQLITFSQRSSLSCSPIFGRRAPKNDTIVISNDNVSSTLLLPPAPPATTAHEQPTEHKWRLNIGKTDAVDAVHQSTSTIHVDTNVMRCCQKCQMTARTLMFFACESLMMIAITVLAVLYVVGLVRYVQLCVCICL
jgi:hypothetical protein